MQKRALVGTLVSVASGALAAAAVFLACGGGNSATGDAGLDAGKQPVHDAGITVFEATVPDRFVRLPETSVPDVEGFDANGVDTGLPGDSGADHTVGDAHHAPDTGADAHHTGDAGVDGGHDSGPRDAGMRDTGTCITVGVPGSTAGAATCPAPVTGTCAPGSLSGFTPTAPPPTGYAQGVCTSTQIQNIYNDCLVGSTCPEVDTGSPDLPCYNCIFTNQGAASWGPVILTSGSVNINLGGCVELLEPCNSACADALEYDFQCDQAACGTNCPITADAGSLTAFNTCATTADGCDPGGCYAYGNGAYGSGGCVESIVSTPAEHAASACFPSAQTFESAYLAVAAVFCGAGAP